MGEPWYYAKEGRQYGPVPSEELKRMATSGQLQLTDLVWKEGMAEWSQAQQIRGLFAPPSPHTTPMQTPVPTDYPQAAPQPAPQPSQPYTGQSYQPHRGGLILTFGILGFLVCWPFGLAAWIMGSSDLSAMNRGQMDPSGHGLTMS